MNIASKSEQANLAQARDWLVEARSIAVLTGAGISAESGIPTFRGPGGLWNNHRPEDLATPQAFARDPKLSWEWYDWRRQRVAAAQPNPGHRALARLESSGRDFALITQNVDGLHRAAGSRNVIELHGSIWRLRCVACAREAENRETPLRELPPRCSCGGLLRPGVVWFGEALPPDAIERAVRAARQCDVFLVCGTSAVVYPAAALPERALSAGARVIELNLEETPFSQFADVSLRGKCGELLPQIIRVPPCPEPLI
ncbi:MAG TPA: NAD-dependent deacylase [Candidatus Acidoferrales bacterium]|nr:NAD-dependent deacylase [Candidatus Acidoferrales bacterium]